MSSQLPGWTPGLLAERSLVLCHSHSLSGASIHSMFRNVTGHEVSELLTMWSVRSSQSPAFCEFLLCAQHFSET